MASEHSGREEVQLSVTGMTCAACAQNVERALRRTEGVIDAQVNLATGRARIVFDPGKVDRADLSAAIESTGYGVKPEGERIQLKIENMSCAACRATVEESLAKVAGVTDVSVNLLAGRAEVRYRAGEVTPGDLIRAVEDAGYPAERLGEVEREDRFAEEEQ
ncbi:MAG: copper ion binding protein, partial [Bacillota bacterium]